jgi:hypothetical protein
MVSRQNKRKIKSFLTTALVIVTGVFAVKWILNFKNESPQSGLDFEEDDIMMAALKARQEKQKTVQNSVANPVFLDVPVLVDDAEIQKANEIIDAAEGHNKLRQARKEEEQARKLSGTETKENHLKKILQAIQSSDDSGTLCFKM